MNASEKARFFLDSVVFWAAIFYLALLLVAPWLWWTRLTLRGEWEIPLLPDYYSGAVALLGPLVCSAGALLVLQRLRNSPLWSWKWVVAVFAWPTIQLLWLYDFRSGTYWLVSKLFAFGIVSFSLRIVFSSDCLSPRAATEPAAESLAPSSLAQTSGRRNRRRKSYCAFLPPLLRRVAFYVGAGLLAVFAAFPMLRLVFAAEIVSCAFGLSLIQGASDTPYGWLLAVCQMANLAFVLLLGLAALRAIGAWKASFAAPVIFLPSVYTFHLWFARYLLGLTQASLFLASMVLLVGATWFAFLRRERQ